MQLVVKLEDGVPSRAPITAENLRMVLLDLPSGHLKASDLEPHGYAPLAVTPWPTLTDPTKRVEPAQPTEQNAEGEWLQAWAFVDAGLSEADQVQSLRASMLPELADIRWRHEVSGITLPNGTPVRTDRHTQTQLTAAVVQVQAGVLSEVRWKLETGFVTLSGPEITAIATAVTGHVAACFAAEETVAAQIAAAATVEDLRAIDIQAAFDAALTNAQ